MIVLRLKFGQFGGGDGAPTGSWTRRIVVGRLQHFFERQQITFNGDAEMRGAGHQFERSRQFQMLEAVTIHFQYLIASLQSNVFGFRLFVHV